MSRDRTALVAVLAFVCVLGAVGSAASVVLPGGSFSIVPAVEPGGFSIVPAVEPGGFSIVPAVEPGGFSIVPAVEPGG